MPSITIYEFDALIASLPNDTDTIGIHSVPQKVFDWLESQVLRVAEIGEAAWLKLSRMKGRKAIQVTSFIGVIRTPDGFQIEVLPKIAKVICNGDDQVRKLLIEMLRCLGQFRHIQTDGAKLVSTHMPLLEVFIGEFLAAVELLVKRGLRSDYISHKDNLFALRGKLQLAEHMRRNICRRDRFFAEFDEFSLNRPENRLLHAALRQVLKWTALKTNQQHARELCWVFEEVPVSQHVSADYKRVCLNRGMEFYAQALAWARLILEEKSPLTGAGSHFASSLLFPMELVFEAFVAKYLEYQLEQGFTLRKQVRSLSLTRHLDKDWFQLRPDLLIQKAKTNCLVLDTKWKLINIQQASGINKYGLDQSDFYQLHAYGQNYLNNIGDVVLIYPKTDVFNTPLPVFNFPKAPSLRLWVLPFCLSEKKLLLPQCGSLDKYFAS